MSAIDDSKVIERPNSIEVAIPKGGYHNVRLFAKVDLPEEEGGCSIIILNQPIGNIDLRKIWRGTNLRVCADGGANRLYEFFEDEKERRKYIPDFITGDFDSLREEVRQYYSDRGTIILHQATQYDTDFSKSVMIVKLYFHSNEMRNLLLQPIDTYDGLSDLCQKIERTFHSNKVFLYIIGGQNGRFDHSIRSIIELYKLARTTPYFEVFLITQFDVMFIIRKGENYVLYKSKDILSENGQLTSCGLLPFNYQPIILNTEGLKYDVQNYVTEMDGNVSTSNAIVGETGFRINSSNDILMNIALDQSILMMD